MSFSEPEVDPIEMMTVTAVYLDIEAFVIAVWNKVLFLGT